MKTILILAATPKNEPALSFQTELMNIRKALKFQFRVEISLETNWNDFNEELLQCEPDIVHFIGHGKKHQGLVLEDGATVNGDRLAALFKLFPSVGCVVMNACETTGLATVIHKYVPCVIGMSQSILDQAAREFSLAFYQGVAADKGYQWAYDFGLSRMENDRARLLPDLLIRDEFEIQDKLEIPLETIDLEQPGGRMSIESGFYVNRPMAETDGEREILKLGSLIRIKGPMEFGKSSLMGRIVTKAEQDGAKTVSINFREIGEEFLGSLKDFLGWFCMVVTDELNFECALDDRRGKALGYKKACGDYFEKSLLPQIANALVLELDEVDRLLDQHPEKNWVVDFFSMLRVWHDDKMKAHPEWKKLRLVLVHSKEIDQATLNSKQSPFNVGREIELKEFTEEQVMQLAQWHRLGADHARRLRAWVGGHPQLVRIGLYAIARGQITLEQLEQDGATEAGLYGNHLTQIRSRIEQDVSLKEVLRRVLAHPKGISIGLKEKAVLRSFGIIVPEGNEVRIACALYYQYFSAVGL